MAHGRADERAVDCHFRDAAVEIVAMAATVLGDPAGEQFLQAGEGAAGEHLCAQGVLFEGLDIGLDVCVSWQTSSGDGRASCRMELLRFCLCAGKSSGNAA